MDALYFHCSDPSLSQCSICQAHVNYSCVRGQNGPKHGTDTLKGPWGTFIPPVKPHREIIFSPKTSYMCSLGSSGALTVAQFRGLTAGRKWLTFTVTNAYRVSAQEKISLNRAKIRERERGESRTSRQDKALTPTEVRSEAGEEKWREQEDDIT